MADADEVLHGTKEVVKASAHPSSASFLEESLDEHNATVKENKDIQ